MPEVTVTLTLKVEHTDRTEVTTFKPPTTLEPGRVHSILTEAAERLTGQQHLPLDAGDADPAFVISARELDKPLEPGGRSGPRDTGRPSPPDPAA